MSAPVTQSVPRRSPLQSDLFDKARETGLKNFIGTVFNTEVTISSKMVLRFIADRFYPLGNDIFYVLVVAPNVLRKKFPPSEKLLEALDALAVELKGKEESLTKDLGDGFNIHSLVSQQINGTIGIIHPKIRQLLSILLAADRVLIMVDALWIHGGIEDEIRNELNSQVRNLLHNFAGVVKNAAVVARQVVRESHQVKAPDVVEGLQDDPS
ncbi:MAG: hypothetical protein G8345_00730 [Magnetococcales bacterium]|nr:hypothetical protein [Magnetococcales bacterium]NGZ25393.1 hypothetical protein [Magnetococcales bacterium]